MAQIALPPCLLSQTQANPALATHTQFTVTYLVCSRSQLYTALSHICHCSHYLFTTSEDSTTQMSFHELLQLE